MRNVLIENTSLVKSASCSQRDDAIMASAKLE